MPFFRKTLTFLEIAHLNSLSLTRSLSSPGEETSSVYEFSIGSSTSRANDIFLLISSSSLIVIPPSFLSIKTVSYTHLTLPTNREV